MEGLAQIEGEGEHNTAHPQQSEAAAAPNRKIRENTDHLDGKGNRLFTHLRRHDAV
jgi:hypothetical protein